MKDLLYYKELGTTAACTIRVAGGTIQDKEALTLLIGNLWTGSVKAAVAAATREYEAIYQIKPNNSLFLK